ncbi:hypothetical protein, partial [Mameliella sp. LZ-28]|uniref:hypothetical protein n=1 Tax=Mameliella sp. LZ-28 TaxID=2484146 RepID=UPI0032C1CD82
IAIIALKRVDTCKLAASRERHRFSVEPLATRGRIRQPTKEGGEAYDKNTENTTPVRFDNYDRTSGSTFPSPCSVAGALGGTQKYFVL